MTIRVLGTPGPQGSKKLVGRDGKGRGILVESSKKVKPWREAIQYAALQVSSGAIAGPVCVEMTFTMLKPKSAPRKRLTLADKRPDLSKLVRSTEDALTDSGVVWEDDARVVECLARKVFPGEHPDSLHAPGAVIRVWSALSLPPSKPIEPMPVDEVMDLAESF